MALSYESCVLFPFFSGKETEWKPMKIVLVTVTVIDVITDMY